MRGSAAVLAMHMPAETAVGQAMCRTRRVPESKCGRGSQNTEQIQHGENAGRSQSHGSGQPNEHYQGDLPTRRTPLKQGCSRFIVARTTMMAKRCSQER